ncbi:MAG: hypothetical protein AB1758_05370 [Candidatus Eremiobacterota bacterium]
MPADLTRLLAFLNQLVVERLQVDLSNPGSVDVQAQLGALAVRHEKGEGIRIEEGLLQVTGLPGAPPKGDPFAALQGVVVAVPHGILRLLPDLWPRLAAFLGQNLASRGGRLLDRVALGGASVSLGQFQDQALPVRVGLDRLAVRLGELDCAVLEEFRVRVDGFVPGKDMKAALGAATIVVESFKGRLAGSFLTRAIDTMRDQIPSMVENFALSLSPGRLTVSGTVRKIVALNFAVDLRFAVQGKELVVHFERFSLAGGLSMPTWLRTQILSAAKSKLSREPAVRIDGDYIYVDPRKRIPPPFKVAFDFARFTVEDNDIVLELTAPPELRPGSAPVDARAEASQPEPVAPMLPPGPPAMA